MGGRRNSTVSRNREDDDMFMPNLKVDITVFRDHIKQKFKQMITSIDSENIDSKLLVIDRSIYDVFRFLFTQNELGVSRIAFFNEELRTDLKHLIFLTPPLVTNMNKLAIIMKNNPNKYIHVVFLPKRTFACKEALQMAKIYGAITAFYNFNFDLVPLDYDLLSLEISEASRLLYFELDTNPLVAIAESLQRLQVVFGKINNRYCKGYTTKVILEILNNIEKEDKMKTEESGQSEIDCLIMFDRNLDYVTPLLTQFTYTGALDEVWGIKQNNFINLEKKFFPVNMSPNAENSKNQDVVTHKLKKDKVFMEIRDCHTTVVASILDSKLGEIKSINDEIAAGNKQNSIKDMANKVQKERKILEKDFDKIATHVEVRKHLDELMEKPSSYKQVKVEQSIVNGDMKSQEVIDYIEAQIGKQANLTKVLKMLCLHSLVENGLKVNVLENLKKDIYLSYGFEHQVTISNLEKGGLLRREAEGKIWDSLDKQLKLINPDIPNFQDPDDASYAYFGYCPVFVRLVENLLKKGGWNNGNVKSALDMIPGSTIIEEKNANPENSEVYLIYMIGGVTYGELAGFRLLGKKYNKQIIVATTSIITGDRLINSFFDKFTKN